MAKKEEKKYLLFKIIALALVVFFVVIAFIEPKATITHVEKQIDTPVK